MKLRRSKMPEVPAATPEDASFCLDIAVLLRDGFEGYRRLYAEWETGVADGDLSSAALSVARRNAAYARLGFLSGERLLANLSAELSPVPALRVLCQLNYALVALGEDEPDPASLLSPADLDELLCQDEVDAWLRSMLERLPSDWSVA